LNVDTLTKRFVMRWFVLGLVAPALFFPALGLACAVCLTGAPNDPVTDAFNWSVLFLMAAPYTIVGSIAGCLFFMHRRSSSQNRGAVREDRPILRIAWMQKGSGK
jgi:hypothetical protein